MQTKSLILIISILIISCKKEEPSEDIPILDFSKAYKEVQNVPLSRIAEKVEYIPLESDTSFLLDGIYDPENNIKFSEGTILIKENSDELFLFDKVGFFSKVTGT